MAQTIEIKIKTDFYRGAKAQNEHAAVRLRRGKIVLRDGTARMANGVRQQPAGRPRRSRD
jgi:hypothetical protein